MITQIVCFKGNEFRTNISNQDCDGKADQSQETMSKCDYVGIDFVLDFTTDFTMQYTITSCEPSHFVLCGSRTSKCAIWRAIFKRDG